MKPHNPAHSSSRGEAWLVGGGEMGALMRRHDWSATPLAQPEHWPQSLKTAVSILLNSKYPMFLAWGPELAFLYNDGYRAIIGAKHPALGRPFAQLWSEIWPEIQPLVNRALAGEATWSEDLPLSVRRKGYLEEAYFTFSYSPIRDETGGIGGMFCAVNETTTKVLGERRLRTLRDLAARSMATQDPVEACRAAAAVLASNPHDVPFAAIYLVDDDRRSARLAAVAGIEPGAPASPPVISLEQDQDGRGWSVANVAQTTRTATVNDLATRFDALPRSPWNDAPHTALSLPVMLPGQDVLAAILIVGVSPRRALDEQYRSFFELIAGQVAAAISDSLAYAAERKRALALAEIDRAKTAFFSNISHEFRTPLTLMLAPLTDRLAAGTLDPDEQQELEIVHRNGLRLLRLVNTLLDFSRIEAGRTGGKYQPTNLSRFTAEITSSFRSAMEKAGLKFVVTCPELPQPVYVDRDMWEKVVLNLISNAFKFTFEGAVYVELVPTADGSAAMLRVRDTGAGIRPEEVPKLFERFHRVEGTAGRSHEGTGIGLALVQELVKLHGGTVTVESEYGSGSSFTVHIPFGTAHLPAERLRPSDLSPETTGSAQAYTEEALRWLPGSEAEMQLQPVAVPRKRVLFADDNADMRDYVRRLLSANYEVIAVADGEKALRAVVENDPDLVLADVMMPNLDGFGLLRAMRSNARTASIPMVMLSARAGEEARVDGLQAGADDYLIKPFTARELLARVSGTLAVTEIRRKTEAALRESEERFRNMADNAPVMIWMTDSSAWCTYLSRRWYEFTGQTPETGLGLGWTEAIHPDDRDASQATFLRANEEHEAFSVEYRLRRQDGEYRWAIGSAAPWLDSEGQFRGYIGSVIDITDRREAEERLRQSTKMEAVGRLAGGLAHDFNNQLHVILGFAEFVARDPGLSPRGRCDLLEIQKVADRMASLTRQLLAYSRRQVLRPETLDLGDAVRESQVMLQRLIGSNIQMLLRLTPEPTWVQLDRGQLLQVLMNLAINARDSMAQGGELLLQTSIAEWGLRGGDVVGATPVEPGQYVKLVITDSGSGIASAHLPHLFEPFFTTKEVGKGTGLGLATVQGIVMQSRGYVWAENAPGGGARFTVLFPLAREPAMTPSRNAEPRGATPRGVRLLVVDDEDVLRGMIARALEDAGYEVLQARHGGEALDRLEGAHGAVDLIISDVVMPVLGGRELSERLAVQYPDLPVVWMSGYPHDAAFGAGTSREDTPFLQKPIPGELLVETVRRVVERKRLAHNPE